MSFTSKLVYAAFLVKKSFCQRAEPLTQNSQRFLDDIASYSASNSLVNPAFDSWAQEWQVTPEDIHKYFPHLYNSSSSEPIVLTEEQKEQMLERIIA